MAKKNIKVKTSEKIATSENLQNRKRWFDGLKVFSSIKLLPPFIRRT